MSDSRFSEQAHNTRKQKRGAVLVCVVACLAVATLLLAGMLKKTVLTKQQIRTERYLRQAEWLVQAGAERAAFRLASNAEYTGELWSLAADAIVGTDPGVVRISVSGASTDRANVRVIAEYPSGSVASIRRTREFLIDLNQD